MRITENFREWDENYDFWTRRVFPSVAWGGLGVAGAILARGEGKAAPLGLALALAALLVAAKILATKRRRDAGAERSNWRLATGWLAVAGAQAALALAGCG
jgi:hypothetical protein